MVEDFEEIRIGLTSVRQEKFCGWSFNILFLHVLLEIRYAFYPLEIFIEFFRRIKTKACTSYSIIIKTFKMHIAAEKQPRTVGFGSKRQYGNLLDHYNNHYKKDCQCRTYQRHAAYHRLVPQVV